MDLMTHSCGLDTESVCAACTGVSPCDESVSAMPDLGRFIDWAWSLKSQNLALRVAASKVIEMNRQHAEDQYGDPDKAEGWSCVTVLRTALSSVATQNTRNENVSRHERR